MLVMCMYMMGEPVSAQARNCARVHSNLWSASRKGSGRTDTGLGLDAEKPGLGPFAEEPGLGPDAKEPGPGV